MDTNKKISQSKQIKEGIRQGMAKAIQHHKDKNQPICIRKNGKVDIIQPEDIETKPFAN